MTTSSSEPLKLFYCYSHKDKALRDELDEHLAGMKRQRLLEVWYDHQILPTGAKPVTHWTDRDDAFEDITKELRKVVKELGLSLQIQEDKELEKVKQFEKALTVYEQAIRENPSSTIAYNSKGETLLSLGRYDEALIIYDYASRLDPNNVRFYYIKALVFTILNRGEEMLEAYDQAIQLDPNNKMIYLFKGHLLLIMNRKTEALAAFQKAEELGYTG